MKADDQLNLGELRALRDHFNAVKKLISETVEFTDAEKTSLYEKIDPRLIRINNLIDVLEKLRPPATITPYVWPQFRNDAGELEDKKIMVALTPFTKPMDMTDFVKSTLEMSNDPAGLPRLGATE